MRPRKHVCLLFRRFISSAERRHATYACEALEARGIRTRARRRQGVSTIARKSRRIRAALAAIEWPDDELSVFATLRGALFAVGDEELLEWTHRFGLRRRRGSSPFQPFRLPPAFDDALEEIAHLRRSPMRWRCSSGCTAARNYVGRSPETLHDLLDATRAHVGFALRTGGRAGARQRAARRGAGAAVRDRRRHLVPRLRRRAARRRAERAQAAEAPILEEAATASA